MIIVYAGSMHEEVILGEVKTFTEAFNLAWRENGNNVSGYTKPNCYTYAYCIENGVKTIIHGIPNFIDKLAI